MAEGTVSEDSPDRAKTWTDDDYLAAKPVDAPIRQRKQAAKRHYGSHPYFTRRAWNVIREYIQRFTGPGDLVLDPFGGSGVTVVEALAMRRRGIHGDINPLANFITEQVAVAPVDLDKLRLAFARVEAQAKAPIERLYEMSGPEVAEMEVPYWYPRDVRLPQNADAEFVHQLFTPRALIGFSILRHAIDAELDPVLRGLLLLAFSATLAKVNRTFVSATGRKQSRGGATIFSVYRYNVPKTPVELPVWPQFLMRFQNVVDAKRETNELIGSYYRPGDTVRILPMSATRMEPVASESVDYIFTDPPYGANIAYVDLSTMFDAWLGLQISDEARNVEVIQGGDVRHSEQMYIDLLKDSIREMFRVLKWNRWMSVVFAHKDPAFWDTLVHGAEETGFEYVNTTVQPVSVVWSMHKKKNPLTVLSGELIVNFRKVRGPRTIAISKLGSDIVDMVRNTIEVALVRNGGSATTEEIYNYLVPQLLENGLLSEVRKELKDITPLLAEKYAFGEDERWHLKEDTRIGHAVPLNERVRFYVRDYMNRMTRLGTPVTFEDVVLNVLPNLVNGDQPTNQSILAALDEMAYSPDGNHWVLGEKHGQLNLGIDQLDRGTSAKVPPLPIPLIEMEHNEVIYRLAKLGLATGHLVHVGKTEQGQSWGDRPLREVSLRKLPKTLEGSSDFAKSKLEQIDLLWLNASDNATAAFEVESSTPITTAFDRFIELLRIAPELARRIIVVAPRRRQPKIDELLKSSHYIGFPLYLETKLAYLYFEDLLTVYGQFIGAAPTERQVWDAMSGRLHYPAVG